MKTIRVFFLTAVVLVLGSCESNTYEEVSGFTDTPTYEANIKRIMTTHCTSCHSVNGTESGSPLETYDDVVAYAESISCKMDGQECGIMPPSGRIPQVQIDMFNLWIAQGYVQQ
ncbi:MULTISPECIES: hypothetical protein [Flavobacterium]|uniref:hypothetical protein n=1 Tax=Flavobacterium TaxID=237 RepID=UPI003919B761